MLDGAESGSILLFHNDLENTAEALPKILTSLRDEGYEFVPVSDLIYWEDYSINAEGKQIPDQKTGVKISADNVDEVMAQYSEELSELGFTDEQLALAAEAVKGGAEIPEQVREVISHLQNRIPDTVEAAGTGDAPDAPAMTTETAENVPDLTEEAELPSVEDGTGSGNDKDNPQK